MWTVLFDIYVLRKKLASILFWEKESFGKEACFNLIPGKMFVALQYQGRSSYCQVLKEKGFLFPRLQVEGVEDLLLHGKGGQALQRLLVVVELGRVAVPEGFHALNGIRLIIE